MESKIEKLTAQQAAEQTFVLPGMAEDTGVEFSNEEMQEDIDGLQLSFPRVKIPSGGAIVFEIPGDNPERPNYAEYLEGVILFTHQANAYWPEGHSEDASVPPMCASANGKVGIGSPGGVCACCQLNQWDTGKNGRGKACKNSRHMYILRSGEYVPIELVLAPTSIRPYNDFYTGVFAARKRATFGSVVRIGLKKMNNGKDDYSVATFQKVSDISGEELAYFRDYAVGFREQIKTMLTQRQNDTEIADESEQPESGPMDLQPSIPVSAGVSYSQVPPVDGDRFADGDLAF